VCVGCCD